MKDKVLDVGHKAIAGFLGVTTLVSGGWLCTNMYHVYNHLTEQQMRMQQEMQEALEAQSRSGSSPSDK
eukprot:CAMPEP_0197847710 /NCGR_PEP_ID=MMETSP1438-20131217/6885_1 /TAXON_ID=1461541 /ORGANISM="Pterosperma sp., Strain CCMP1384" /LENGTH=67 /DNA_ID=CAMNT_0043459715 /DNA_START=92 /DNA_END=295 /DNA_ORIENTATION=-